MKIGIFDSGYGGLTILQSVRRHMPSFDYVYLGDNARAPYGTHSFDIIYHYTIEAVRYLINHDCTLIILACNTASAKALRTIQQVDLPLINAKRPKDKPVNVLGVIRPTVEIIPSITQNRHIGILATPATTQSESYPLELNKVYEMQGLPMPFISQQACPMWVPIIESGEHTSKGADYFIDSYLSSLFAQDNKIDTIILGCTHYPLLKPKIEQWISHHFPARAIRIVAQGKLVAERLHDYITRHPEYYSQLTLDSTCHFLTTENADRFAQSASLFLDTPIQSTRIRL